MVATVSHFDTTLLTLGCLLVVGALASGLAGRSFLSLTALFVLTGFVLGTGGLGVLHFSARSPFVSGVATVALVVILLRDGLEVDGEMLQAHWHLPLRKLVLAMPLTAVIVAAAARLLIGLTWTESVPMSAALKAQGVDVTELFWPAPHEPKLPHEYQFHLRYPEARQALAATIDFLAAHTHTKTP